MATGTGGDGVGDKRNIVLVSKISLQVRYSGRDVAEC